MAKSQKELSVLVLVTPDLISLSKEDNIIRKTLENR
jgi:hypothetical protein